jgi:hypothetical protein
VGMLYLGVSLQDEEYGADSVRTEDVYLVR